MKNRNNIIKNIIYFILGGIVFGTLGVYAATTLLSQSVYYNNSTSGATSTNVQGALDELYEKTDEWINPSYIDFGTLKACSSGQILASKNGLCIKRNNKVSCFKINNWAEEQTHVQQVFSDIICSVDSNKVICDDSYFKCFIYLDGAVSCNAGTYSYCSVPSSGNLVCR